MDGINITLREGDLLGVVGESGSGKSVTMLALMGLLPWTATVTADRLTFDGRDLLGLSPAERRTAMRAANPLFIPRNHRVEEALAAAEEGDLGPFERLRRVLARPFDDQPDEADLARPPRAGEAVTQTFCGT